MRTSAPSPCMLHSSDVGVALTISCHLPLRSPYLRDMLSKVWREAEHALEAGTALSAVLPIVLCSGGCIVNGVGSVWQPIVSWELHFSTVSDKHGMKEYTQILRSTRVGLRVVTARQVHDGDDRHSGQVTWVCAPCIHASTPRRRRAYIKGGQHGLWGQQTQWLREEEEEEERYISATGRRQNPRRLDGRERRDLDAAPAEPPMRLQLWLT